MAEIDILRVTASLTFILALIFVLAWLARRAGWMRSGAQRAIRVVSTQSLGPRAQLALVDIGGKRLLLGVTSSQITLLDTLPAAEDKDAESETAPSFATLLKRMNKREPQA